MFWEIAKLIFDILWSILLFIFGVHSLIKVGYIIEEKGKNVTLPDLAKILQHMTYFLGCGIALLMLKT